LQKSFEITPIAGMVIMLFGTIYGFILHWGPILWGLIGLGVGIIIGSVMDIIRIRVKTKQIHKEKSALTEVFLLVHCLNKEQTEVVKLVVSKWSCNGVAIYKKQTKEEDSWIK